MKTENIAILELDHPGISDPRYRARRNFIAQNNNPIEYTKEENQTWQTATTKLDELHRKLGSTHYLKGKLAVELPTNHIPQLEQVSERLHRLGGFSVVPVGGLIDAKTFLSRLGRGIMSSTRYIRHASNPEYTPEPDIIHEVVGHIPMFADAKFVAFSRLLGQAAEKAEETQLKLLERLYWFTVEFGLIEEHGELKAYGAGLLSSFGELPHAFTSDVEHRPFNIEEVVRTDYSFSEMQNKLFVIRSFDELIAKTKRWIDMDFGVSIMKQ